MENSNILILSAGRRVELVQIFQRSLKQRILGANVYTTDLDPRKSAACNISDDYFTAPPATSAGYVDFLLDICKKKSVGMVVPTIDTELYILALNKEKFEAQGINLIVSSPELIGLCRDKRKSTVIYDQLNIEYPSIYDKDSLLFPCFCKPYDGSSSIGAQVILTEDELTQDLLDNQKNMFMEYVDNGYVEYTIDAYYNRNNDLCCLVPRKRLEVRSGEVSKGQTRKNFVYNYLLPRISKLTGANGCITFQVFADEESGSIKALEINPRFGGGYPLADAAGGNYVDWLINEYFMGEHVTFYDNWKDGVLMLRYDAKVIVNED